MAEGKAGVLIPYEYTRDNLCVLNLRGGEYASEPALFLRKKYWTDAMAQMEKKSAATWNL